MRNSAFNSPTKIFSQVLQGGQDLLTEILDYYLLDKGRKPGTTERTFDRTLRHIKRRTDKEPSSLKQTEKGLDLSEVETFFKTHQPGILFLVSDGGNPDGFTVPVDNLQQICEIAKRNGGVVELDAAYSRLYFAANDKTDLKPFKAFIEDGTLSMVFSATKEGGERGPAYAIGSEELMKNLLPLRADRMLSPNYGAQRRQAYLETITEEELRNFDDSWTTPFQRFLKDTIRPHLALSFATIRTILVEAGVRLTTEKITHGYNVAVLLPEDCTEDQAAQFFTQMKKLGIESPDLTAFSIGRPKPGFRIPFGGFTPGECHIIATLVAQAHRDIFG